MSLEESSNPTNSSPKEVPSQLFERKTNQKGGTNIHYKSNIYTPREKKENYEKFRCSNRRCRAYIEITDEVLTESVEIHNHPNIPNKIKKRDTLERIRTRALETSERPGDILVREIDIRSTNIAELQDLPMAETIKDQITRDRAKQGCHVPQEVDDIPDALKLDREGRLFLRYDSGTRDDARFIIFVHQDSERFFENSKVFLVDGTFRTAPKPFKQVVVFHTPLLSKSYPYIYVLVIGKKTEDYIRSFTKIKDLININPLYMVSDFEKGLNNALTTVFNCEIGLCHFHFGQAVWRQIQEKEMSGEYKKNGDFSIYMKKILLLAFLRDTDVKGSYLKLKSEIQEKFYFPKLDDFFEYFERVYIGQLDENGLIEKEPIYRIEDWSVFDRQAKGIPRTINAAEGWHRHLNAEISNPHPNIAQFISKLLDIEQINFLKIQIIHTGRINWILSGSVKDFKINSIIKSYNLLTPDEILELLVRIVLFNF